jgi:hypothetical protein
LWYTHTSASVDQRQFVSAIEQVYVAVVIIGKVKTLTAAADKIDTIS